MADVRVPLTAPQVQQVQTLLDAYHQAEAALRAAVGLLCAGHVEGEFQTFRLEPTALIAVLPE